MRKYLCYGLFAILIGMMCGCYFQYDPGTQYPGYRANSWYCAEIDMIIEYELDQNGDLTGRSFGTLPLDDQVLNISVGFQKSAIGFLYDEDGDGGSEQILKGTWTYKDGNMVITVIDDTIFGGQYPELVFTPQDLE